MIPADERRKVLAVDLCRPRVLMRPESVGVRRLADLADHDAWDVMHEVNLQAGRTIWQPPMAILALQNLIDAAGREPHPPARRTRNGTLAQAG